MKHPLERKLGLSALILILTLGYNSCQRAKVSTRNEPRTQNTVAGNPMTSEKIAVSLCEVVHRCHPEVTFDLCLAGVKKSSAQFYAPLGLSSSYRTLGDMERAEQSGVLISGTSAGECTAKIENFKCDDPIADAAYIPGSDPFLGSANLLSKEACGGALTPSLAYKCEDKTFLRNASNLPVGPGPGTIDATFSITPDLPDGLSLDAQTGVIAGRPTALSAPVTYTITAVSGSNSVSTKIQVQAADGYRVDDLGDESGIGTTCSTAAGTCTLRAAIAAANLSSGTRVIVAPPGTIAVSSPLRLTRAMEIRGDCENGTVVDGQGKTRVFEITAGPTSLSRITVQNGHVYNNGGAGILIDAESVPFTTNLNRVTIRANRIDSNNNGMDDGAGIFVFAKGAGSMATLVLNSCTIADNLSNNGHNGAGVGLWFDTHAQVQNCTFSGNQNMKGYGGAMSSQSGSLDISGSTFADNSALIGEGGAIYTNQQAALPVKITNTTFYNNRADMGGAVYIGNGGGKLTNVTFVGNRSNGTGWAPVSAQVQNVTVENSIFAGNMSGGVLRSCDGVSSGGYNVGDTTANDCGLSKVGDQPNKSAQMGPLQGNGGPTQTMAPVPGSPAIGNANPDTCPQVDQRGFPRLTNGLCSVGAFE